MKMLIAVISALLLSVQVCLSQNIVWERRLSWPSADQLTDVVAADSGNYLAVGISIRYGFSLPGGSVYGVALVKFDQYGDTSFVRHLGGYYTYDYPMICRGAPGEIYVVVKLAFTSRDLRVLKLDYDGNIQSEFSVRVNGPASIIKTIYSKTKDIYLVGIADSFTSDSMRVIRVNTIGIVLSDRKLSGGGTNTWGQYIEETPNGTYLASGTTSSNIWAVELDSNGNQLRQGLLYRNSRNVLFTDLAVKAAPDNRFIAAGNFRGSNASYYLGSHNALSNIKNWGGEKIGEMIPPFVNNDGSIVFYYGTPTNLYLSKIDADSTPIWEVSIYNRLAPGCFPRAISYLSDSSAVLVGYTNDNNSSFGKDFYIARIAGVGVPYDPTTPVAIRPQLGSKSGISIWPQPASHANGGTLHFGGFAGPATLALYNMKGQQVLPVLGTAGTATTLLPRQPVPIGHLPPGLYVYRIVAKDRVWTGKVVIGE